MTQALVKITMCMSGVSYLGFLFSKNRRIGGGMIIMAKTLYISLTFNLRISSFELLSGKDWQIVFQLNLSIKLLA